MLQKVATTCLTAPPSPHTPPNLSLKNCIPETSSQIKMSNHTQKEKKKKKKTKEKIKKKSKLM